MHWASSLCSWQSDALGFVLYRQSCQALSLCSCQSGISGFVTMYLSVSCFGICRYVDMGMKCWACSHDVELCKYVAISLIHWAMYSYVAVRVMHWALSLCRWQCGISGFVTM